MPCEYRHERRVEFAETDLAGIVHFATFLRYVEEAEHAFYRSLGLSVHTDEGESTLGFPRVAVRCEYLAPARFEDVLSVHLWLHRKGSRSLVYQFTISREDSRDGSREGRPLARGEMTVVCCRTRKGGQIEAVEIPPAFSTRLEAAPHAPLVLR